VQTYPQRKRVYIASPFTAETHWQVTQNIRRAEAAGLEVAKLGAVPVIPHSMYGSFDGELNCVFWLDTTIALLCVCDAILLCEGWRRSQGCVEEAQFVCYEHPIPRFYMEDAGLEKLQAWLPPKPWQVWKRSYVGSQAWRTGREYIEPTRELAEKRAHAFKCQGTVIDVTILPFGDPPPSLGDAQCQSQAKK